MRPYLHVLSPFVECMIPRTPIQTTQVTEHRHRRYPKTDSEDNIPPKKRVRCVHASVTTNSGLLELSNPLLFRSSSSSASSLKLFDSDLFVSDDLLLISPKHDSNITLLSEMLK